MLLRHVLGDADPDEAARIERLLAADPALRADRDRLVALHDEMKTTRADSFAPYFSDRVMRRLRTVDEPVEAFYASFRWAFARASIAAAGVAIVLGAYNLMQFGDLGIGQTFLETLFGLPSAHVGEALLAGPM